MAHLAGFGSHRHRNQDQDMRIRIADMPETRRVPRMTIAEVAEMVDVVEERSRSRGRGVMFVMLYILGDGVQGTSNKQGASL